MISFPEFVGADYDYKPYNNVEGFFNTGVSLVNSVNLSDGSEKAKLSVNYTNNEMMRVLLQAMN